MICIIPTYMVSVEFDDTAGNKLGTRGVEAADCLQGSLVHDKHNSVDLLIMVPR
jgi:hypothetical protein